MGTAGSKKQSTNQRADDLGLIFDSDPRYTSKDGGSAEPNRNAVTPDTTGGQSLS